MKKTDNNIVHFWYKTADIFEDVYNRTSWIGKHRTDNEGNNMIEPISFSRDEAHTLYMPFLRDAASEVYMAISSYNIDLPRDYKTYAVDSSTDINNITDSKHSVYFVVHSEGGDLHLMGAVDTAIYEAIINYIIWKWLLISNTPEAQKVYFPLYKDAIEQMKDGVRKLACFAIGQVTRHIY